jgi:hypothetical protein
MSSSASVLSGWRKFHFLDMSSPLRGIAVDPRKVKEVLD